jgi:hypothetical protein
VACALAAGLALSPHLWWSTRLYPLTPVWPGLPSLPFPWDRVLYAAMLAMAVAAVATPRVIPALAAVAAIEVFQDQSRCQPWFYQYVFLLIAAGLGQLPACRLIVGATYFWSGVQKCNPEFIGDMFPWMVEPLARWAPWLGRMGVAVPIVEIAIGIGLFTRFRRVAIGLAILTHGFVLLTLGPASSRHNSVIWPWNVAMVLLVLLLFWNPACGPVLWGKHAVHKLAFVLFVAAPVLSLFNLWDAYLSGVLYAANRNVGVIYMNDAVAGRLPEAIQEHVNQEPSGIDDLPILEWSYGELNVPPYPEVRVLRNVARAICAYARRPEEVTLVVRRRRTLAGGPRHEVFQCGSLEGK